MKDSQIAIIVGIVLVYYYLHSKGRTASSRLARVKKGWQGGSVNTFSANAGNNAQLSRQVPSVTSATAGNGTGYQPAPVVGIGTLNGGPRPSAPGTGIRRGLRSSAWSGVGGTGISPTWPTTQVTSTGSIRVGSGRVQVPSYTAVPSTTRGPGGGGSVLNLGGS